jgi:hypothetical protein
MTRINRINAKNLSYIPETKNESAEAGASAGQKTLTFQNNEYA